MSDVLPTSVSGASNPLMLVAKTNGWCLDPIIASDFESAYSTATPQYRMYGFSNSDCNTDEDDRVVFTLMTTGEYNMHTPRYDTACMHPNGGYSNLGNSDAGDWTNPFFCCACYVPSDNQPRTRFTFEDLGNYEFRMWAAYSQTSTSYCLALEATTSPTRLRFAPSTDSLCTGDRSIFSFSA